MLVPILFWHRSSQEHRKFPACQHRQIDLPVLWIHTAIEQIVAVERDSLKLVSVSQVSRYYLLRPRQSERT